MSLVAAAPYIARTVASSALRPYMTPLSAIAAKGATLAGNSLLNYMKRKGSKATKRILSAKRPKLNPAKTSMKSKTWSKKKTFIQTSSSKEYSSRNQTIVLSSKPVKKTYGQWKFTQLHQNVTSSAAGVQGYTDLYRLLSRNNGLGAGLDPGGTGFKSIIDLRDMNPYRKITGSGLHVNTTATPLNDSFVMKSIIIETEILNGNNIPVDLDLYWYTPKGNGNTQFINDWDQALINDAPEGTNQYVPCAAGSTVPAGGVKTGGFSDTTFPGEKPFSNRNIRKNYRLLKMCHVNLAVGVNELLTTKIVINKKINPSILFQLDDRENIRGLTVYCFAIQRGTAVIDGTAIPVKATYGQSQCAMVHRVTYNMCAVRDNTARLDVNYVGSCIPANTSNIKQFHIDEDSEAVTSSVALF